ncbi:hypothetical protein N781_11870 [Pontibacillus halophilus JSM 076056 = DSM 19796]|uniref:DUF3243 domain-containing protein n=1 Tax=Pontibacillus halophilus JSM 076056 = DSM 19796 TaxID=1385510 RepID=A0A0A5IB96_9BACI|nr:DUF3243 domain-containing protein [Pontibacillus halophilus]KGX93107.1 hypothetical protein N781_11870 [Pontibacillus halophilus JSM 076056 = DSM 19796]
MSVLENWDSWKGFLGDRLSQAQSEGMQDATVNELAFEIGDYLVNQVNAENAEEAVLRDLWQVADQEEQHAIANMMVKLVKNNGSK